MSQRRNRKLEWHSGGRLISVENDHPGMCESCFESEIGALMEAIFDVVGSDEEALETMFDTGKEAVSAIMVGAGEGHHHLTVSSAFGVDTIESDVVGDRVQLDNVENKLSLAFTHLAAVTATGSPAGITLRSITDSGVELRGWAIYPNGEIEPLDEVTAFSAYSTAQETGDLSEPGSGVDYRAAYPLED